MTAGKPHIVIVGAGFGGLKAALGFRRAHDVRVTVIDRRNHHLFQPLLYQVATAGLSPADIAVPIRSILRKQAQTEVILGEVSSVDPANRALHLQDGHKLTYDYLVLATGARHSYFGHDEWAENAPGLKSISDATEIRRKILIAFEAAESEPDPELRKAHLNFVIVGGGPTGVEIAGSIAELAHVALASDFRHIDPTTARVILIEAGPRLLAAFPEDLAQRALHDLTDLGVEVRTSTRVQNIDTSGVYFEGEHLPAHTVIWAAGVMASPAARWVDAEADRAGRAKVSRDLTLPGHPEIFVIGDTAWTEDEQGNPLPGLAPVAMQQGTYVARSILARIRNGQKGEQTIKPFRYIDKGNMATIGRKRAIAAVGKLHLAGFIAWVAWLFVHIFYLITFRNRVLVLLQWTWAYFTFQRGARLIVQEGTYGRQSAGGGDRPVARVVPGAGDVPVAQAQGTANVRHHTGVR